MSQPDVEVLVTFTRSTSATGVYEKLISELAKNCEEFEIKNAYLSKIGKICLINNMILIIKFYSRIKKAGGGSCTERLSYL